MKGLLELKSNTLYGVHRDGSSHEPADQFRRFKHFIDNSEVAKRAPKGALLHCHSDAMLPPSELISIAQGMKKEKNYIKTDAPLTDAGFLKHALPTFQVLPKVEAERYKNTDNFGSIYVLGEWMLLSIFRLLFPGGVVEAGEWTLKFALDLEDIYHTSHTVNMHNLSSGNITSC